MFDCAPCRDLCRSAHGFWTCLGGTTAGGLLFVLALGFVAYPVLKLFSGRGREVSILVYVMAVLLGGVFVLKAAVGH